MQLPASQTSSTRQACPHAPQLAGSDARTAHRAPHAAAAPLQEQVPPVQDWIGEQAWSQAPQWSFADCRSTHPAAPQKLRSREQLGFSQRPRTQICPPAQTIPQVPQFHASDWRLTHELPHWTS
jgi:hypothetical protein